VETGEKHMSEGMKIIAINDAPTVSNKDLNRILANIGGAEGRNNDVLRARNDALRAYIYALRDRQRADAQYDYIYSDESAYPTADDVNKALTSVWDDVNKAQAAVERAFEHLIVCQFALNRS
jgi:hypothetical protein